MDILARNKFIILGFVLVAAIGVVAFVDVSPEGTVPDLTRDESVSAAQTVEDESDVDASVAKLGAAGPARQEQRAAPAEADGLVVVKPAAGNIVTILKDVGEAALDHFGLTQSDFFDIKQAGFDIIEGNFDICAEHEDVRFFLDSAQSAGLKVILNAGSGEAEWGYSCDGNFAPGQKPIWQRGMVSEWVNMWKGHPALYAWDTSNEDGGTFPYGTGGVNPDPDWETKYALSTAQLQEAYRDVKSFDPSHPVMIRMNGWYFYDYPDNFFRSGNAFGKNVADIVMVNAYSNVDEYFQDFVTTVLLRATRSMYGVDSDVRVIPALGVWSEPPTWVKPTPVHLINDFNQALKTENLAGIAFFKYGTREGSDWFLPDPTRGDPALWQTIRAIIAK